MRSQNTSEFTEEPIVDFFVPDEDKISLLRSILELERGYEVTFNEAEEIGIQLITLYQCLARERSIVGERNG